MNANRLLIIFCSIVMVVMLTASFGIAVSTSATANGEEIAPVQTVKDTVRPATAKPFILVLFWADGCSHCADEKAFLRKIASRFPNVKVIDYEVWNDQQNRTLMGKVAKAYDLKLEGVPVTFIDKTGYTGFSLAMQETLLAEMERCSVEACVNPLDQLGTAEE